MTLRRLAILLASAAALSAAPAAAAITTYGSQSAFEAALDGSFTLVNLDSGAFTVFGNGWNLDDPGPAAALLALGLDSVGYNANVVSGQNFQTPTNRDWLIANGANTGGTNQGGQIAFNFTTPVNGVGAISNIFGDGDGGRVRIFSGADLSGTLLGEFAFGVRSGTPDDPFGGITSTELIRSAQFTCDFNADLRCGVYDIQFGTFAADPPAIPEPGAWALMIAGFGATGAALRRRRFSSVRA